MKILWNHLLNWIQKLGNMPSSDDFKTSKQDQNTSSDLPNLIVFFKDTFEVDRSKTVNLSYHLNIVFSKCRSLGYHYKKQGEEDGPFHMQYSLIELLTRKTAQRASKEIQEIIAKEQQEVIGCKEWIQGVGFVNGLSRFLFACYLCGYECSFDKYETKLDAA